VDPEILLIGNRFSRKAILEKINLGNTDIKITPLGFGAWAWGDRFTWGYGRDYGASDIELAAQFSLDAGINFYDTAEIYGQGHSERLVGRYVVSSGKPVVIASKFFPYPWRLRKKSLVSALRTSLQRLGLKAIDLYQIHWPYPPVPIEAWASGLADVVEAGLARAVGVSNYNYEQMRRANGILVNRGVTLASNQVEYHLLDRKIEKNGLLNRCKEMGISLISYSPLAQGLLTGKYTPEKPLPGSRGRRYGGGLITQVQPLIRLMGEIGQAYDGKTPSQVALNWIICKGAIPIPGVKNAQQAEENAGALGWRLSEVEIAALDKISDRIAESR